MSELANRNTVNAVGGDAFPQVFGKYVLLRPMAKGGMGELFLAAAGETGGFEKLCVVKKVLGDLTDLGVRRRFLDEAKVVVRLNHSNLVQVFDAGRVDAEHYLAMELIEGKDLRAVWNRCAQLHRRIPVDFALFVAREVARGLAYVHDAMGLNLVHRDISPPNILVGYHGQVKITDFGLAKHAIKRELTNPGVVFGRYSYLSPEQARGLPADRRTDIYAVGIILWEMLTGRQLFPQDGRDAQILKKLRKPDIRPPSEIVPGIPEGVDEIVLAALAVEREERFQNGAALREQLSKLLAEHFPRTDVDRVSTLMREIFAREVKLESQDYASFTREDFSPVRALARADTQTISISEAIELEFEEIDPGDIEAASEDERVLAAAQNRVGSLLSDRYRLLELLSVGGMGAVYKGVHEALGTTYAIKILHAHYGSDAAIISRFRREARAATQTGHPNIIDVIEVGTTPLGDTFSVMELLKGRELREAVQADGPFEVQRAVHVTRQICDALVAAHEAGIIHRDLKSANVILLDRGGDADFVKVLDFGICKHFDDESTLKTTPGLVMGSPDYMAPEQAAGAPADVKSDVYAVGTILFELLTGRLPFEGRNAIDVLMQKGGRRAPSVLEHQPAVPVALANLVAACLHRSMPERPESMRALEYLLVRAADGRADADAELEAARSGAHVRVSGSHAALPATGPQALVATGPQAVATHSGGFTTVHDQALRSGQHASVQSRGWAAGAKALAFVGLGGALATVSFFALSTPSKEARVEMIELEDGGLPARQPAFFVPAAVSSRDASNDDANGDKSADAEADTDDELIIEEDETGDTTQDAAIAPAEGGGEDGLPTLGDASQIAARAQLAFDNEHWREPIAGSLALELTNLGLVDPGHESIARLRSAAAKKIAPVAKRALRKKVWAKAVLAYRDLFAIYPDYDEDARGDFGDALRNQGRVQRRLKDHLAALATADELLNVKPNYFPGLKLRADSLASLGRWEEAVPAYRAAMRARPSSKDAKKGYWRARGKLAKHK